MYDVLHDSEYRREWDSNVIDTHDIAQVAANADVGYYACECGGPGVGWCCPSFVKALVCVQQGTPLPGLPAGGT